MLKRFHYRIRRNKYRNKKYSHKNQINTKFAYPYKRQRRNKFIHKKTGAVLIIIFTIALIGLIMLFPHFVRKTYRVTITNKQIINRDNTNKYLIYAQTEDGKIKVFENTNNFLELKFNSEDLYWTLSINRKYEIVAYGFNIPLLLRYQNIVNVKGIDI